MISGTADQAVIESKVSGQPNQGKILVAVGANITDVPLHSGGTCAKLMDEGYEGYLVRTSNDELCGDGTIFQNMHNNETETARAAEALGFREVLNLYYQNPHVHGRPASDLIMRLIFVFRMLKADTVITLMPSGFDDTGSEKEITFNAVKQAAILAGNDNTYPEHLDAGLTARAIGQLYIAVQWTDPSCNRVVDIGSTVEEKIDAILACTTQGVGRRGSVLRRELASEGKRLPVLGEDDTTADREYVRHFIIDTDRQVGQKNGLDYAETFCHVDRARPPEVRKVEAYIKENALSI